MKYNLKHSCTDEKILSRRCMYLTNIERAERLKNVFLAFHNPTLPEGYPDPEKFERQDQYILDALVADLKVASKSDTTTIALTLTYEQIQRCANILWDYSAISLPFDSIDAEIYKSLVNLLLSLEYDQEAA